MSFIYNLIMELAKKYLIHRYFVGIDEVFWKNFLTSYKDPVLTLDYSQNIALKPKYEVQAAHFSGRQHTLHCCVMEEDGIYTYLHHLSDDTSHDNVLTFAIIKDIIKAFPRIIVNGKLVLHSDNASTPYKSRFVFHEMKALADEYGIEVIWFHGEAGHGRGLVDSMSSFGCKSVLCDAIITSDTWFPDAESMHDYLSNHYKDDDSKYYQIIDPKSTAERRLQSREEHELRGCLKCHLIAVNQHGVFTTRTVLDPNDDKLLHLQFDKAETVVESVDELFEEQEVVQDVQEVEDHLVPPILYEVIAPDSYVALRSRSFSIEQFFVVKVVSKDVAKNCIVDASGHMIPSGEPYLSVVYLDKYSEGKKGVQFHLSNKTTERFIHLGEIFATNVSLNSNLFMEINEYLSLCHELY